MSVRSQADVTSEWLVHLESEGYQPDTVLNYRAALRHYLAFITEQGFTLYSVTPPVLDRWRLYMRKTLRYASRSINSHISAIRNLYKWLRWNGHIKENLLADLRTVKPEKLLPRPFSEEEIGKLLEAAKLCKTPMESALLETFYSTGCRISEVLALNFGDVHLEHWYATVFGKGLKERNVPIGRPARKAIEEWTAWLTSAGHYTGPEAPMFIGRFGKRLYEKVARLRIKRVAARAGVTGEIKPHRFRHSFCTHMYDHGADIRAIQKLAGHESLQSTEIYTKVSNRKMLETFNQNHPRA